MEIPILQLTPGLQHQAPGAVFAEAARLVTAEAVGTGVPSVEFGGAAQETIPNAPRAAATKPLPGTAAAGKVPAMLSEHGVTQKSNEFCRNQRLV